MALNKNLKRASPTRDQYIPKSQCSPPQSVRRSARLSRQQDQPTSRIAHLPSPAIEGAHTKSDLTRTTNSATTAKRKRISTSDDNDRQVRKKRWSTEGIETGEGAIPPLATPPGEQEETATVRPIDHPVAYWAAHSEWPEHLIKQQATYMDMFAPPPKRSRADSQSSYTSGVKDGSYPQAWTDAHELRMEQSGLFMQSYLNSKRMNSRSNEACAELAKVSLDHLPEGTLFNADILDAALRRIKQGTEARVQRDFTPLIVPPAEFLHMISPATYPAFEYMSEDLCRNWVCTTLEGPIPRPDYTIGISPSAFTPAELTKLRGRQGHVDTHILFPFLVCELKIGANALEIAQRQSMHAASIAVDALIKLYATVGLADELDGEVLAFSVSHNAAEVKIHAHFAAVKDGSGGKTTFHRHEVYGGPLVGSGDGLSQWRAYNIVMAIYSTFFPKHLARVRRALKKLPERSLTSSDVLIRNNNVTNTPGVVQQPAQEQPTELAAQIKHLLAELQEQRKASDEERKTLEVRLEEQRKASTEALEDQKKQFDNIIALLTRKQ